MASSDDSSDCVPDEEEDYDYDDDFEDYGDDDDVKGGMDLSVEAAKTKVESFSVKRKTYEEIHTGTKKHVYAGPSSKGVVPKIPDMTPLSMSQESGEIQTRETEESRTTEAKTLARPVPGQSQPPSEEFVPLSGDIGDVVPVSGEIRDMVPVIQRQGVVQALEAAGSGTTVFQQNIIQVEQTFGGVTVEGARNLTIGGTQNIGKQEPVQDEEKALTRTETIRRRTLSRIEEWTPGMVKTSAFVAVMQKLDSGITWVTIKGSPGEGKTTVAFLVLGELHKSGVPCPFTRRVL